MNYIKNFKIFESTDHSDIEEIVKNRLYSVSDDLHDIQLNIHEFTQFDNLHLFINFEPPSNLKEYSDDIKSLISELESLEWHLKSSWAIQPSDKPGHLRVFTLNLDDLETIFKRIELRFEHYK
jgi:hypothetical protein